MKSTTKSAIVTTLENRLEQLDTKIDRITQRRNKMLKTIETHNNINQTHPCLLYTSPSPRD